VAGTWKDLTDSVNSMAGNLTEQVRGIARVVTAVAQGELDRKLTVEAKGEIAALAETINGMTRTLATFADQVTSVAREVGIEGKLGGQASVPGAAGTWRDLTDNVNQLAANLTSQVRAIGEVATAVTRGDLSRSIQVEAQGEVELLKDNVNEMIRNLRDTTEVNTEQDWLKTNLARFSQLLQGQRDLQAVGRLILSQLAPVVGAQRGAFYLSETDGGEQVLNLLASYAAEPSEGPPTHFRFGEGLVGQSAHERRPVILTDVPADYIAIRSALGQAPPSSIAVLPVLFEDETRAVIELASFDRFSETHLSFLEKLTESIGIVLNTIAANMRTEELLKQSQALTIELQQTNLELEDKATLLSRQNEEVERRRREIDEARAALEQKAEQLALTSKYKSQFLANMSHELRTPLNSLLILSQQLAENDASNLTEKQVEFASTIRSSGQDLLVLINDILDLSKIESGTTALDVRSVPFRSIRQDVERTFQQLAVQKGLELVVEIDPDLPRSMSTDPTRLQQVLKNLLSNAFKFTIDGGVTLALERVTGGWSPDHEILNRARTVVAFRVSDTGIGIAPDKQGVIFEAFQQADMDTSRRFGGTGLGLAISREIAGLLGGEIGLTSALGEGSVFSLYVPLTFETAVGTGEDAPRAPRGRRPTTAEVVTAETDLLAIVSETGDAPSGNGRRDASLEDAPDDRSAIAPGDRVLLIIEDDRKFAQVLLDAAHGQEFKGVVTARGDTGLDLAKRYQPVAIVLDLLLPDVDGWTVLDRLKHDAATRHIPVHVISGLEQRRRALDMGAIAHLTKPVSAKAVKAAMASLRAVVDRPARRLLVVGPDPDGRTALIDLVGGDGVEAIGAGSGSEALAIIEEGHIDCVVVELGLPDMTAFQLIESIKASRDGLGPPVIVYTGRDLSRRDETRLRRLADTVTVRSVRSPERLLGETALFLHRVEADLSEPQRAMLRQLRREDPILQGRRVLVVDDDMRNIFAITSALEPYGMEILFAENGRDGIRMLKDHPDVDVVLLDIMMPEMDGFETTREIRAQKRFANTPIIALTAKAMPGDRERCIDAGASDYIPKPVAIEQLLSLLRVAVRPVAV
jgi:signal transduction histidine kinase/CheY-like chemotaxis protein/HAMP domain-containing protein